MSYAYANVHGKCLEIYYTCK